MGAENTYIMKGTTFSNFRAPHLIVFGEPGLKGVCWEVGVDVSFLAAPVTGMDPNYFAKQFFDFWDARLLSW